ncbi:MAG: lipoyl(octanoyl) transferase [Solirubrobacterales bacterium]|jgi:lipoyl(octanoyl) transferase|nr:lipoyl(octanoyl) transferase [Solirubrobacterales bacterium]
MSPEVLVVRCGLVPYDEALVVQRWLRDAREDSSIPDVLLLLEHPPVYTRGRRSTPEELPMADEWYEMQGIELRDTDRGGRVTYHGPGQLVAYPIVDLRPYDDDVHEYVRRLERVAISALGEHGVTAQTIDGLTGVWTEGEPPGSTRPGAEGVQRSDGIGPPAAEACKIGSIGVHVSRGITTHGLSVNVNNDLQPFEWVVPCGIEGCQATSLSRELGSEQDFESFAGSVAERFADVYGRVASSATPSDLGLDSAKLGIA